MHSHTVINLEVQRKWLAIPPEIRKKLQSNVWCGSCFKVVTIENYEVHIWGEGLILKGNCSMCGQGVARAIEVV
jgi:hypothetical protein